MTASKTFKRRVRERMSKTGESYTAARTQVAQKKERNAAARARLAEATQPPATEAAIKKATGKSWDQWFAILDRWGAQKKKHGEVASYVGEKYGVSGWWSQAVTVGYERARGMRTKYQNAEGFSVSASKTIGVPVGVLFEAVVDDVERKKWLEDGPLSLRTSQEKRSARFDWEDGSTRVNFGFTDKGASKSTVAVAHERLPDADEAETMKAMWKERLADLKSFLEA